MVSRSIVFLAQPASARNVSKRSKVSSARDSCLQGTVYPFIQFRKIQNFSCCNLGASELVSLHKSFLERRYISFPNKKTNPPPGHQVSSQSQITGSKSRMFTVLRLTFIGVNLRHENGRTSGNSCCPASMPLANHRGPYTPPGDEK